MLSRTRQTLVAIVAVVIVVILWFVGNDSKEDFTKNPDPAPAETTAEVAPTAPSGPQPASVARGVPRDGTLDPISIDPNRSMDRLPVYQADTILDDYRDDAGAADDRYRGQYFIVEGVATGIRRDGADVILDIRTNDTTQQVRALLLPEQICGPAGRTCEVEARATMVRRGQKVAVECNGAGISPQGSPLLADCLVRGGAN